MNCQYKKGDFSPLPLLMITNDPSFIELLNVRLQEIEKLKEIIIREKAKEDPSYPEIFSCTARIKKLSNVSLLEFIDLNGILTL